MKRSDLGRIIYERRKQLGLTQEDIAKKIGVKPNYIGYLERNLRRPSFKILKALADVLGLNPGYLYVAAFPHVRDFLPIDEEKYTVKDLPYPAPLQELKDDVQLRKEHGITDDEIEMLAELRFRGYVKSKMDYLFVLLAIRKAISSG